MATDQPVNLSTDQLLDLAAPERFVTLRIAGREARHIFRPLTLDDWAEYMKAAAGELVSQGDTWTSESEADAAAAALWEKTIVRVEGYKFRQEFTPSAVEGQDWKANLPLGHKTAAVGLLQEVYVSESPDPFDLEADCVTVVLEAGWNSNVFQGLHHHFQLPSQMEAIEYRRLNVQFYRKRGARNQATRIRIPSRLRAICALWDKMILEVSGYQWPSEQQVQKWMCPLHKLGALTAVMAPAETQAESPEVTPEEGRGD